MNYSKRELITRLFINTQARWYKVFVGQLQYIEPQIELVAPPFWRGEETYDFAPNDHHPIWSNCHNYTLRTLLGIDLMLNIIEVEAVIDERTHQIGTKLSESRNGDIVIYTNPERVQISPYSCHPDVYALWQSGLHHMGIARNGKIESKWGHKGPVLLHQPQPVPLFWGEISQIRRVND